MTLKVGYGSGVVTAMNLRGQLSKLRVPLNILLAHITGKSFGLLVISCVKRATLNCKCSPVYEFLKDCSTVLAVNTLQAVVSPGRALRYEGRETTASIRLLL